GTVRIFDLTQQREPVVIKASEHFIRAIDLSADVSTIACADDGGTVALFDAKTGRLRSTLPRQYAQARGVCFTPDGQCVLSCEDTGAVHTWVPGLQTRRSKFKAHGDRVWSLVFARDGRRLVPTSSDRTAIIWDWPVRAPVQFITGPLGAFATLKMAPDG